MANVKIRDVHASKSVKVVAGKVSQGANAFKDYSAPNGTTLRIMNPDIRREANRRAAEVLASFRLKRD